MRFVRTSIACFTLAGAVAACSTKSDAPGTTGSTNQAVTDQAPTSVSVFHSTQSGGMAKGGINVQDDQHFYSLTFDAWENKSANSRTASLSFWGEGASLQKTCYDEQVCTAWDYNTWSCTSWETIPYCYYDFANKFFIYGYGDIPTSDFRVGAHTAHLTTDLSNDTSFTAIRCAYDAYWNFTCTPLTGTIDVVWTDNGLSSSEHQGTWSTTNQSPWGTFTMHSSGRESDILTDTSGTFLGDAVSGMGSIGQSKDTTITKDVYTGPASSDGGAPPPPPPPDGG